MGDLWVVVKGVFSTVGFHKIWNGLQGTFLLREGVLFVTISGQRIHK